MKKTLRFVIKWTICFLIGAVIVTAMRHYLGLEFAAIISGWLIALSAMLVVISIVRYFKLRRM